MDLGRGLTMAEVDALIGDRDYRLFLNPKNEIFRERKMKDKPPSRAEALKLMSGNPNLIRRPILVKGRQVVVGFSPEEFQRIFKKG